MNTLVGLAEEGVMRLATISVQVTLILLFAGLLTWLLSRSAAALRHRVWALALAAALLVPVASPLLPGLSVPISMPAVMRSNAAALDGQAAEPTPPVTAGRPVVSAASTSPVTDPGDRPSMPGVLILLAAWFAGALVMLGVTALAFLRACQLVEAARPVESRRHQAMATELARAAGVNVPLRLLVSPSIAIPLSFGFGRASVLVPVEFEQWSDARFRAVLVHELAHVRRNDGPIQFLAQLACAIHWFHPLAWIALWRLRCERERACDDVVLLGGVRPSDYASHLLAIAGAAGRFDPAELATLGMARPGELEGRLLGILDPRRIRRAGRGSVIGVTAAVIFIAGFVAALRPATAAVVEPPVPVAAAPPVPAAAPVVASSPAPLPATAPVPAVPEVTPAGPSRAIVDAWIVALRDPDPLVRKEAAFYLGTTRDRRATSPLIAALADPSPLVRHEAAFSLGNRGYRAAVDPLVATLSDPSADVRHEAAFALGIIGDPRAVPALTRALAATSPQVRKEAAWALEQIRETDESRSDQ